MKPQLNLARVCFCGTLMNIEGPAPIAKWSRAFPLTACCHFPLSRFKSELGHVRKLPVTCRFSGVFCWILRFSPPPTTSLSQLSCNKAEKVTINEIPKKIQCRHLIPALNAWVGWADYTKPYA